MIFPRNIVQDWLSENRKFIDSENKKIQFDIKIVNESNNLDSKYKCEYLQGDSGRFSIKFGEKQLISNGEYWINIENRTKQAIIQSPDSTFLKNISLISDFKKLQKLMSMSILKKDIATFFNDGTEIKFKFLEEKLNEVDTKVSGNSIVLNNIRLQKIESPDSSYFKFNENEYSIIDLRE